MMDTISYGEAWQRLDWVKDHMDYHYRNGYGDKVYHTSRGKYYANVWRMTLSNLLNTMKSHADIAKFIDFFMEQRTLFYDDFELYPEIGIELDEWLLRRKTESVFLANDEKVNHVVRHSWNVGEPDEDPESTPGSVIEEGRTFAEQLEEPASPVLFRGNKTEFVAVMMAMFSQLASYGYAASPPPYKVLAKLYKVQDERSGSTEYMAPDNFMKLAAKLRNGENKVPARAHAYIMEHVHPTPNNLYGDIAISR